MEYASTFLMSFWPMAMVAARSAVAAPITAMVVGSQSAEAASIGLMRIIR